ncbi:unnamed protein product [Prorocentrum cordatum]|uniref:HTTM domain-containing protein n=1 Tax=Prorocentrum cordatum TaxID=2364126 RepID=A0ABN9STX3_9DINO|nr:unnamed protein product [Polarella glacialis]
MASAMTSALASALASPLFSPTVGSDALLNPWVLAIILAPAIGSIGIPTLLTFVPHDGKPQLHTPDAPPPEEIWRAMPFLDRVTHAARDVAAHSPNHGIMTYWKHIRFWIGGCVFNSVTLALVPRPYDMSLDEWAQQAFVKSVILHAVGEGMGFFKQGPLWGNRAWPDTWKYQITPGTLKQPLFPKVFGHKRTYFDVAVHGSFFVMSIAAQLLPRVPTWWIWVFNAQCTWCMVSDFHLWLQRVGYTYMYLTLAAGFPANQGRLAGMQLVWLFQRLGCGVGKLGPWFCYVIGIFMQSHPTCKDSENYRSLIHRGPDDFGPSTFCKKLGYFAELWETFWPMTVLLTFSPLICRIGVAGLVAMHTFIIIAPAFIDVVMWNVAFIIGDVYLFVWASCGFDWTGLLSMHPMLVLFLVADLFATTVLMQYPKACSRYFRHAHYTGNWPQMSFLIKKSVVDKVDSKVKTFGNKAWNIASDGFAGEYKTYKGLAYSWLMNLDAKIFPALVQRACAMAGETPDSYYIQGGHHFMEYLQGAGCDGQQGPRFAKMLCKECGLEPGDLLVVWIWAFPVFQAWLDPENCKAEWEIHDSTQGTSFDMPIAKGAVSMHCLMACDSLPTAGAKLLCFKDDAAEGVMKAAMGA